jgi:hypothetical protein
MGKNDPLLSNAEAADASSSGEQPSKKKVCLRKCGVYCGGALVIIFALAWALQGILYGYYTLGCGPLKLKNFEYKYGDNIFPEIDLLIQRPNDLTTFDSIPANENGIRNDVANGVWRAHWGPIFTTYTFADASELHTLLYMRQNLLNLGQSHRIVRCDKKGPHVTFKEGSENYFLNKWRSFRAKLFGSALALEYDVYMDDGKENKIVASGSEVLGTQSSLIFKDNDEKEIATASLDEELKWRIDCKKDNPMPNWVPSAATVLFGTHATNLKAKREAKNERKLTAMTSEANVPYQHV